jgi:hypothetical protein
MVFGLRVGEKNNVPKKLVASNGGLHSRGDNFNLVGNRPACV